MLVLKIFVVLFTLFFCGSFLGFRYADYRWKKGQCPFCEAKAGECQCM